MMRYKTSQEVYTELKEGKEKRIVSFLPVDKSDCDCFAVIQDWSTKFTNMSPEQIADIKNKGVINCPRANKAGYKNYEIICAECGDLIATVALKNGNIDEWCNLHYISEAKVGVEKVKEGKRIVKKEVCEWHGCMTPNISPVDGKLGFECACGNDSRDFRMAHLTNAVAVAKMKENMIGRNFGEKNSKFILKEII